MLAHLKYYRMPRHQMKSLAVIAIISVSLTWAASQQGQTYSGIPLFALCAGFIFLFQWLAFVPAYLKQTEVFYDLIGSTTYISVVLFALLMAEQMHVGSLLISGCILLWALRLGSFLFKRILEDGSDGRFDKIKPSALHFFVTWNLQALWVLVTAGCALAALTSATGKPSTIFLALGFLLWAVGFGIEVLADSQKRVFRRKYGSEKFMDTGLWSRSRHPNYFGEILLWAGIAVMAAPALSGWQHLTLVSPVFVYVLLTKISGIPLLERKADRRWADDPAYQAYKDKTPVLVPRFKQ